MREIHQSGNGIQTAIFLGDIAILNIVFLTTYFLFSENWMNELSHSLSRVMVVLNLCYLICNVQSGILLHKRVVRIEQILTQTFRSIFIFALLSISILAFCNFAHFSVKLFSLFYVLFAMCLATYQILLRIAIKLYRKRGGNRHCVVLVGSNENAVELFHVLTDDPTSGFRVMGYFDLEKSDAFPQSVPYLGKPQDVIGYLEDHPIHHLYCSLPSNRSEMILPIVNYCENHLIRFFCIPNVRNYLKRTMRFELLGNIPILCIRKEPLSQQENRLFKRLFDIVLSTLFLCTLFPVIYLIIGTIIKLSSRGPVISKKKCCGEDGKEFWCCNFRTRSDKGFSNDLTLFGRFLLRSNMDKCPQFINVIRGEMSIIGPRPHKMNHTEAYSQLINRFMVRHFIKPGITGWAQVSGFRGEIQEIKRIEKRVKLDIWYIEHWSFMLDLLIVYKTIILVFKKREISPIDADMHINA